MSLEDIVIIDSHELTFEYVRDEALSTATAFAATGMPECKACSECLSKTS